MASDLSLTTPFVITQRQSVDSFAMESRLSADVLLELNPHLEEVGNLFPGIPINLPPEVADNIEAREASALEGAPLAPIDWAVREWERGISEYPGPHESNPEIEKYHAATSGVQPDDIAWCSSFVNWCVRKANLIGTDNKAARSWHRWGSATENPKRGDIVVFKRKDSTWKGHTGFFWEDHGSSIQVLGGNQSNSVRLSNYPKNGTKYALLSVRKV